MPGPSQPIQPAPAAALLFDGGAASTLAALRTGERFGRVHLLSFVHRGTQGAESLTPLLGRLTDYFGDGNRFSRHVMPVDRMLDHLGAAERTLGAGGLFAAATCDLCRVVFHWRALVHCLQHGIHHLADGALRARDLRPAQCETMSLPRIRSFHERFGVVYETPVYEEGETLAETLFALRHARSATPESSPLRCDQAALRDALVRLGAGAGGRIPVDEWRRRMTAWIGPRIDLAERLTREFRERGDASTLAGLIES